MEMGSGSQNTHQALTCGVLHQLEPRAIDAQIEVCLLKYLGGLC